MPLPLLFCFHGFTSSADVIMAYSRFNAIAEANDFIVVYPQGTLFSGIASHWNVGGFTDGSTVDDVGFVDALLTDLLDTYHIDSARVYSTGMSNGGFMSFLLACQLSDKIAAVASVTGSMTPQTMDECDAQRPISVLQIHGDADAVVPYSGESFSRPIPEVLNFWIDHNACSTEGVVTDVPDSNTTDGTTVSQTVFEDGSQCTSVHHFTVQGGDHSWPGAWGNQDINASQEVWNFVSQFDLNGRINCLTHTENISSSAEFNIFPNPVSDFIYLENNGEVSGADGYSIFDWRGRRVKQGQARVKIDVSDLSEGLYYMKMGDQIRKFLKS